jgi:DNA-binding transcriptional LysR family regulator
LDRTKTLEELEGDIWEEPTEEVSHLIERCHALRRVPIQNLTPADLRILIGQSIGLEFLAPLVLEFLERAPLIDAEFYPGDLLRCTLSQDSDFIRSGNSEQKRFSLRLRLSLGETRL